jgi:hypothetical protein
VVVKEFESNLTRFGFILLLLLSFSPSLVDGVKDDDDDDDDDDDADDDDANDDADADDDDEEELLLAACCARLSLEADEDDPSLLGL